MMGRWSKLINADCNMEEDPSSWFEPCKTIKVAMLRNNLDGMLTMESRVKSHRLTRRLVIIHSLTFYYFSEINYFNFCHFFSLGAISYFCLLFSVDKCMTGSLSSKLAQAGFNREEDLFSWFEPM